MEERNEGNQSFRNRGNDRYHNRDSRPSRGHSNDEVTFSKKVRAGKRTYFFDVKPTRANDFFICISESKKTFDGNYQKNKIFLYKEDFNKFLDALGETVTHVKKELMPDYNFEEFDRKDNESSTNSDINSDVDDFSDI